MGILSTSHSKKDQKIILIDSNIFNLNATDIENAFLHLDHSDMVIGPSKNGGYYLLGIKKMNPDIFQNKNWGTETVLTDTLNGLEDESVQLLETKNNIDRYGDIKDDPAFQHFLKNL